MARPRSKVDPDQVESLAAINCTMKEIAAVVGCSVDTLERRFADRIAKGKEIGKSSLRRMMWQKCKEGNITMMIFMSKQILGYSDKQEQQINVSEKETKLVIDLSGGVNDSKGNGKTDS